MRIMDPLTLIEKLTKTIVLTKLLSKLPKYLILADLQDCGDEQTTGLCNNNMYYNEIHYT